METVIDVVTSSKIVKAVNLVTRLITHKFNVSNAIQAHILTLAPAPIVIYRIALNAARVLFALYAPEATRYIMDLASQKIAARLYIVKIASSMFLINAKHVRVASLLPLMSYVVWMIAPLG